MPNAPEPTPASGPAAERTPGPYPAGPGAEHCEARARRVRAEPNGPLLIEGPVEFALPDGSMVRSDRFQVAVCLCLRSATYPWCDTSHRRRPPLRKGAAAGRGNDGDRADGRGPEEPPDRNPRTPKES